MRGRAPLCSLLLAGLVATVPGARTGVGHASTHHDRGGARSVSSSSPPSSAPAPGMVPVYRFVLSARRSLDMTMYELSDPEMVADLITDPAPGREGTHHP